MRRPRLVLSRPHPLPRVKGRIYEGGGRLEIQVSTVRPLPNICTDCPCPSKGLAPGLRGLKMKQHPRCPGQLCLHHKLHPEGPPTGMPQRSGESGDTVSVLSSVPLILHLLKHPSPTPHKVRAVKENQSVPQHRKLYSSTLLRRKAGSLQDAVISG